MAGVSARHGRELDRSAAVAEHSRASPGRMRQRLPDLEHEEGGGDSDDAVGEGLIELWSKPFSSSGQSSVVISTWIARLERPEFTRLQVGARMFPIRSVVDVVVDVVNVEAHRDRTSKHRRSRRLSSQVRLDHAWIVQELGA
jgi:hypothetical protein